jgi:hypothetical protein
MTPTDWIQAISTFILLGVTGFYAWRTHSLAKATEKQTEASVKMAEEMREQRFTENLPLLTPEIQKTWNPGGMLPREVPYVYLQTGIGIEVIWTNMGKGIANNIRFSFIPINTSRYFPPRESEVLPVGKHTEIKYDHIKSAENDNPSACPPRMQAEYEDIYERKIITIQELRVDEKNKRAFLGDLYFMINGRRIGKKVGDHD